MTPKRIPWELHSFLKETIHSHVSHSPCISSSATSTAVMDSDQPQTSPSPPPSSSAGMDLHIGFLGRLPLLDLGLLPKHTWRPWIPFQTPYDNHESTTKTHLKVLGLRLKSNYQFGSVPLKSWVHHWIHHHQVSFNRLWWGLLVLMWVAPWMGRIKNHSNWTIQTDAFEIDKRVIEQVSNMTSSNPPDRLQFFFILKGIIENICSL